MKNLICKNLWVAVAASAPVVLASMAVANSAKPIIPALKHGVSISSAKKNHAAAKRNSATTDSTVYDSIPGSTVYDAVPGGMADATVYAPIPGTETLTLAQAQQAVAAAQAGKQALAAGNLGAAEADFRLSTGIVTDAITVDAVLGLAQTLEQEGKNEEAIRVYRYLLYPKPHWGTSLEGDDMLRMRFALLLADDGQWAEAVSVYENTIGGVSLGHMYPSFQVHFSPDVPQPALFRAMAHLVMGVTYDVRLEYPQAASKYRAAVNAQPDLALAHFCYGHALCEAGRRAEAKAAFEETTRQSQGDVKQATDEALKGF